MPWVRGLGEWYCVVSRTRYVVIRYSRQGYVIGADWGVFGNPDAPGQIEELQEVTEQVMKRRSRLTGEVNRPPHANYDDLLESWPSIAAWLTDSTFEDGEARRGGWMSLWADGGQWHAFLRDSAEGVTLRLAAGTVTALLGLVEHCLSDPLAPWRVDEGQSKGGKGPHRK